MECYARLNTRITKPHEAQEKGQQLALFELNGTMTRVSSCF